MWKMQRRRVDRRKWMGGIEQEETMGRRRVMEI
jgi:hypothetical protein